MIHIQNVGGKKIKEYMIDQKIPRHLRSRIPLVADDSQVIWIPDKNNIFNSHYRPENDGRSFFLQFWVNEETENK